MDNDLLSIAAARRAADTAFKAYQDFLGTDPAQVDAIVEAMARAVEPECARLGQMAHEETGYGNPEHKRIKDLMNARETVNWLRDVTTLGMLWRDDATKIAAFGEPMGVVAALIPVTNPTSTIIFKVLSAVKAGNAIVCAPHPRGLRCGLETVKILAQAAEQAGAPKGLVQCLSEVTIEGTDALMKHRRTSIIMATGGPGMVKAAYSCGKPTLAVGAGNVPCYVHGSMKDDLDEVAEMIVASKSFDYGTACVSEQAVIADPEIARDMRAALKQAGCYFCTPQEADRLAKVIFLGKQRMNPERVGQAPEVLAELAGFSVPPGTKALISEETEIGWHRPLSAEKLNPVMAFYAAKNSSHGIELAHSIAKFEGWGHSAVVHSNDPQVVADFARVPTGRVLVNVPAIHGGAGYATDMEPSFMLGTGTWSGSITSDNVTALHLINIKRVAYANRNWRDIYEDYG
ncbi:Alcohol dehydrogenase [Candidatus Rhodobacter oscarellae]|uniref:Alcohol dehydrogenase n=1 Tax=Candidatus Rhodobacter oscarellae TaxID=1675527 RepID=A0A0J9E952_9RHOB|nr:aldehyde dehydrogenase family protein [Candidatus Rhodobacter lobularis]KMW59320.1 Alcohol dehydrogenase [Candidatus Rhodobacter lobularis]